MYIVPQKRIIEKYAFLKYDCTFRLFIKSLMNIRTKNRQAAHAACRFYSLPTRNRQARCGSVTLRLWQSPGLSFTPVAPLRYALDSGSNGRKAVQVQVLLPAPKIDRPHMLLVDFILCQHGIGRSRCGSVTLRLSRCKRSYRKTVLYIYWLMHS